MHYSGDHWPRLRLREMMGSAARALPDHVVEVCSTEEVRSVVVSCAEQGVPIVPVGGASGICGGTVPVRGGVAMDLKGLSQIHGVDPIALTVDVDSGVSGDILEGHLNALGLTLGHFPPSMDRSTVGGWIATRSAGKLASLYGKIEDLVLGLEVVTGAGEVLQTGSFGTQEEIDFTPVFVGSEGTLGVVTRALLRVHRAPEARWARGFLVDRFEDGVAAMREAMHAGIRPGVLRLYDPFDTFLARRTGFSFQHGASASRLASFLQVSTDEVMEGGSQSSAGERLRGMLVDTFRPLFESSRGRALYTAFANPRITNRVIGLVSGSGKSLLIAALEGGPARVAEDADRVRRLLEKFGAEDLGDETGQSWLDGCLHAPSSATAVFEGGAFVDTIEVSATWGRAMEVHDEVRRVIASHALVVTHFSHAYPEGCAIQFTFAGSSGTLAETEGLHTRVWDDALNTVLRCGGAISHHHGIGLLKRKFLAREMGDGWELYAAVKSQLDPQGILNPGKLLPDAPPDSGRGRS